MHGKVVTVRPQAVQRRKLDRQDQTVDSEKNVIHRKQIVNVIDAPHSGRQGEVQHFHGNFVFLSSPTMLENGGIFVCKTQHLVLPGGSKGASGFTAAVGVGRSQGFRPLFVLVEVVMVAEVTAPEVLSEERTIGTRLDWKIHQGD